jgi:hypothetical protein
MQALGEVHDTDVSWPCLISGFGVGWTAQALAAVAPPGPGWRATGAGAASAMGATPARVRTTAAAATAGTAARAAVNETGILLRVACCRAESA